MSNTLVAWPRRYTFNEWKQLPRNKDLSLEEAQELFRRESIQYTLYEQELLRLETERRTTINSSFLNLQSYVLNMLSGYEAALQSTPILHAYGGGATPLEIASDSSPEQELITEDEFLLMTEEFEHLITE